MKKILFEGDSITDCLRDRESDQSLGQGYAFGVGAHLGYERPGVYQVLNRGVSGDRVVDLYARCKRDCWNLAPDYLSVLIGVNDVWHEFSCQNGVEASRFHRIYHMFLAETREQLPDCKIMLIQPFCLPGAATDALGYDDFRAEVVLRAEAVRALSREFHLPCLGIQAELDQLAGETSPDCWLVDGVHPTPAGHGLLTAKWLELFLGNIETLV